MNPLKTEIYAIYLKFVRRHRKIYFILTGIKLELSQIFKDFPYVYSRENRFCKHMTFLATKLRE